jgi:hypothetical protein
MREAQIDTAVRRPAAGLDLFQDGEGRDIAGLQVRAVFCDAVAPRKLLALRVEKSAAELIAEGVPHNRVHPDQAWSEVANRKKLYEFHVDETCPGAQSQCMAISSHIGRGAIASIEAGHPSGCNYCRLRGDDHRHPRAEPRCDATAPTTAPSMRTRSMMHRSPALQIAPARLMTERRVFDTAGPVFRKST